MQMAKLVAFLGMLAMGSALVYGFTQGDLSADGQALLSIPWGVVSLVDVYVGFTLFSGWVVFRERHLWAALLWVALIMVLGFFIASLYALLALFGSGGDWQRFWMGHRAEVTSSVRRQS
jgi:hypothetical protein